MTLHANVCLNKFLGLGAIFAPNSRFVIHNHIKFLKMKNVKFFCSLPALIMLLIALFASLNQALGQTPELDQLFNESLSQVKGLSIDTANIDFEAKFPTLDDWEITFDKKWLPVQAQVQNNLSNVDKNKPGAEKKILAEKYSATAQYKAVAEEVKASLLNKAEITYNTALNELARMNLSNIQRQRELSELSKAHEHSQALIKAKAQEIENRFNPAPPAPGTKKEGTVISEKIN